MYYKKIVSILLLSCFLMINVLPASAAEKSLDKGLTEAINQVKATLEINTDLWDQFDYYVVERDQGNRWHLTWSSSTEPEKRFWVECDQKGHIYQYNISTDEVHEGLGTLTEAQGLEKACEFIKKVAPDLLAQLVPFSATSTNHGPIAFNYTFAQEIKGTPIKDATVSVSVDKYNGKVIAYQVSDTIDLSGETYPAKEKAIPLADAKKAYLDQCGLELVYRSHYDYQKQKLHTFPVYQIKQSGQAIDALTGKVVSLQDLNPIVTRYDNAPAGAESMSGGGASKVLTPQEQKAVDGLEKLITKEAALAVLPKMMGFDLEGYTVTQSQLEKMPMEKELYMWSFNLSKPLNDDQYATIYGTVDAQNGQLLSFYRDDKSTTPLTTPETPAQAEKKVNDFLNKVAKDQLSASQVSVSDQPTPKKEEHQRAYFNYNRMVNGVPFYENGLHVTYDLTTGQIASYTCDWYQSATFADLSKVQPLDWMMESISKQADFTLQYVNGPKENSLIYDFVDKRLTTFDPFTGDALNWRGQPYQSQTLPTYQGLDGSSWAKSAQVLLDNGIYLNQTKLDSEKAISEKDFLTLLARVDTPYLTVEADQDLIDLLVNQGVLAKGAIISDQPITRAKASTYVVKYLGYEPLALQPEAFVYPYVDPVDAKDKGYLAIAAALSFITADSKNQLNPTAPLSLGESFTMMHQVAK